MEPDEIEAIEEPAPPEVEDDGPAYVPPPITGDMLMAVTGVRHILEQKPKRITVADKSDAEMLPREIRRSVRRFLEDDSGPRKVPRAKKFDYGWALDHITKAMEPHHREAIAAMFRPEDAELAADYIAAADRLLSYLQSILPIRVEETMAKSVNFDPSDTEIAKFRRAFDVADDPMIIMRDLELGILIGDQVQHLAALYPEGYVIIKQTMATGIAEAMARKKSWSLPWRKDRLVQTLFQTSTFNDSLARDLQQSFKTAGPDPQGMPPAAGKSSAADQAQTKTQEVAEGAV